jgi:ubiquinone/menaquinone biosynthesis C-methylase UbiE
MTYMESSTIDSGSPGEKRDTFVPWYMQPQVVDSYESWYEGKYKRADLLEKRVLELMLGQFQKANNILEIGCGTGHFTRWFNSQGANSIGVDLSPFMAKKAKSLWRDGEFVNAPSVNLPFRSKTFDVAVFVTCFEYMPDPVKVLREADRIADQGIVMGLMNSWSLPTLRRKLQLAFGKNDYYRRAHFYSIREIKSLCRRSFNGSYSVACWRTTLFPKPLKLERDTGNPFGAFLGVALKRDQDGKSR